MEKKGLQIKPGTLVMMLFVILVLPFLPLLISRRWGWWEAWVFALTYILSFVVSRVLAARRNPDIIQERASFMEKENTKPWDKLLALLLGLGGGVQLLAAGLDALVEGPLEFSLPVEVAALIVLLAGYAWSSYALIENRFFSGVVRIQTERGHRVVSTGPYAVMRHPGYAGAVLSYLAAPFFLDSAWTILPSVFLILVMVIRTRLEDRTLQEELDGYREYAKRVRYRLVPGVW